MLCEIKLLKQSIKWIVHWCLSWAIIKEEFVLVIHYSYNHVMIRLKWFLTLANCFDLWKQLLIKSISAKQRKWICSLMCIKRNDYRIICVSNLLQFEPCSDMFKLIFDFMAHCFDKWNTIINELCINVYYKQSLWNKMC